MGLASGETEQAGLDTSMMEDQQGLQFFKAPPTSAWVDWTGVNCAMDEAPGWSWHRQSDTSYTVNQQSNAC